MLRNHHKKKNTPTYWSDLAKVDKYPSDKFDELTAVNDDAAGYCMRDMTFVGSTDECTELDRDTITRRVIATHDHTASFHAPDVPPDPTQTSDIGQTRSTQADKSAPTKPGACLIRIRNTYIESIPKLDGMSSREVDKMAVASTNQFFIDLQQQNMKPIRCVLYLYRGNCGLALIAAMGIVLMAIGISILLLSGGHKEYIASYSDTETSLSIDINEPMKTPIYVYAKISNFYANHRRYTNSRPHAQCSSCECEEINTLTAAQDERPLSSLPAIDTSLNPEAVIHPCGLSSFSIYNDVFDWSFVSDINPNLQFNPRSLSGFEKFILYATRSPSATEQTWIPLPSAMYRAWSIMQFAPTFKIGLGVIEAVDNTAVLLPAKLGQIIPITTNLWPSKSWHAKKALVFESMSPIGSSQYLFSYITIGWGGVLFLIAAVLYLLVHFNCLHYVTNTLVSTKSVDIKVVNPSVDNVVSEVDVVSSSIDNGVHAEDH